MNHFTLAGPQLQRVPPAGLEVQSRAAPPKFGRFTREKKRRRLRRCSRRSEPVTSSDCSQLFDSADGALCLRCRDESHVSAPNMKQINLHNSTTLQNLNLNSLKLSYLTRLELQMSHQRPQLVSISPQFRRVIGTQFTFRRRTCFHVHHHLERAWEIFPRPLERGHFACRNFHIFPGGWCR